MTTTATALQIADKKRIATEVVQANHNANAKDIEANPEWIQKSYGVCGGPILGFAREKIGIAVPKPSKKLLPEPTVDELTAALELTESFGGDATATIAFLQKVDTAFANEVCTAQANAVRCLMKFESMKGVVALLDKIKAAKAKEASVVIISDEPSLNADEEIGTAA